MSKRIIGAALIACLLYWPVSAEPYRWRNVVIVGGGFVTGLITHPRQRGLIYARTDVGGAYRRDSPTGEWIPITDMIGMSDWRLTGIESLAVDPSAPNRVYLAVPGSDDLFGGVAFQSISRSLDNHTQPQVLKAS